MLNDDQRLALMDAAEKYVRRKDKTRRRVTQLAISPAVARKQRHEANKQFTDTVNAIINTPPASAPEKV
jgi:1,2-phenylacetyl-CoA epoxidase PaaB subunit